MNSSTAQASPAAHPAPENARLDYLDATRAFALLLGVLFHACMSFMPVFMGWAVQDISTSPLVAQFVGVSHTFRMETFFLLAGFLSHLTFHRKGAGEFIRARLLRIVVPFVAGWFLLRPLMVSGWIMGSASLRGDADVWAGLVGGFQSLSTLPAGIFTGSHLWFLYYLVLVTTLTLLLRALAAAAGPWGRALLSGADALAAWLAKSPFAVPLLALPTAGALWFMRYWGMDTPDQSLMPHVPALLIFGGFFGFGWMLSRQRGLIVQLSRLTLQRWILAALGVAAILLLGHIERDPAHPRHVAAHVAYAFGYSLTMWSLALLTIGLFRKFFHKPSPAIRYLADSSYWMYLIHLPLVVWLQVAAAEIPLHWSLKLAAITALTIALSLATYDLFVRSTAIGWLLNGRRRPRALTPWLAKGRLKLAGQPGLRSCLK